MLREVFTENLNRLVKEREISNVELADSIGVTSAAVSLWRTGKGMPRMDKIDKICEFFGVGRDELLNERLSSVYETKRKKGIKIPILGYVAGGKPLEMVEDIIGEIEISEETARTGTIFALKLRGDSMSPRINNGDVVIVRQQSDVDSGALAIVAVNGDVATCKQIKKHHDGLELIPFNPSHPTRFFTWDDVTKIPVTIIGKVIELRAFFE